MKICSMEDELSYKQINISGINVTFAPYGTILSVIDEIFKNDDGKFIIGYANAHTIVSSDKDKSFNNALNVCSLILADGIGIHYASKIVAPDIKIGNIFRNATDFNYEILKYADQNKKKVYLFGSTDDSLSKLVKLLSVSYPYIEIVGTCDGYVRSDDPSIIDKINSVNADILLIGMGPPKQEIWLGKNVAKLHVPVIIMVGAFFDFVSGEKNRAPKFFQLFGLVWFFRLLQEPRRLWKRYIIGIPHFIFIVLKQKFSK